MQGDKLADDQLSTEIDSASTTVSKPVVLDTAQAAKARVPKISKRWIWLLGMAVAVFVLTVAGLVLHSRRAGHQANQPQTKVQDVNLGAISQPATPFQVDTNNRVVINGQLQASQSLVLAPTSQPSAGVLGQIYLDTQTHQLRFYNGSSFVTLVTDSAICSISGVTCNSSNSATIVNNITNVTGAGLTQDQV